MTNHYDSSHWWWYTAHSMTTVMMTTVMGRVGAHPSMPSLKVALCYLCYMDFTLTCDIPMARNDEGQSNDPNVLLAAVSVPVMQLNIVPSASEAATPAVQAASPQPIAKVGAIISQSQVVPSDTHDELNAMVDVSKSCTRGGGGGGDDEVRAECVAVELRVWERTPYKAVPSADWNWMTEVCMYGMNACVSFRFFIFKKSPFLLLLSLSLSLSLSLRLNGVPCGET